MLLYILGLSKDEIIANAILFYLAGFETTASTLNWLFYELAMNPEQQQKVRFGKTSAIPLGVFQSENGHNRSHLTHIELERRILERKPFHTAP